MYNIGIYCEQIYHLLDKTEYLSWPILTHSETGQSEASFALTVAVLGDVSPIGSYCFQLSLLNKL